MSSRPPTPPTPPSQQDDAPTYFTPATPPGLGGARNDDSNSEDSQVSS